MSETLAKFQMKSLNLVRSVFITGQLDDMDIEKDNVNISTSHKIIENEVVVLFELSLEFKEIKVQINVAYQGVFTSDMQQEDEIEKFAKINGPAIIFPSIRQHVRHLTLEAGMRPLILPLMNFTRMKSE